jgi:hypothetical protein
MESRHLAPVAAFCQPVNLARPVQTYPFWGFEGPVLTRSAARAIYSVRTAFCFLEP